MPPRFAPLAVLALAACGTASKADLEAIDTLPGGIVRVMNAGPGEWSDTNGWTLVLERTIQPAPGTAGELLEPRSLFLRADGSFVVGEDEEASFRLFDSTGTVVRTIGRKGDGPGEYRSPSATLLADTLIIHDPAQVRITFTTLEDSLLRSFPSVCCIFGPAPTVDLHGNVTVTASRPVAGSAPLEQWVIFDHLGRRIDSMLPPQAIAPVTWSATQTYPGGGTGTTTRYVPLAPQNVATRLLDGTTVYGATNANRFFVTSHGTDTTRIFGRTDVAPIPAPEALRDSLFERASGNPRIKAVAKESDIPSVFPLWSSIAQTDAGDFWVGTGGDGAPMAFDVYDSTGRLRGSVARPWGSAWATSWAGSRVAVLDADSLDLPRIRIYRLTP